MGPKLGALLGTELESVGPKLGEMVGLHRGSQVARQLAITPLFLQRFKVLFLATHLQFLPFFPFSLNEGLLTHNSVGFNDGGKLDDGAGDIVGASVGVGRLLLAKLGSFGTRMAWRLRKENFDPEKIVFPSSSITA